jgi:hypothetical protein
LRRLHWFPPGHQNELNENDFHFHEGPEAISGFLRPQCENENHFQLLGDVFVEPMFWGAHYFESGPQNVENAA